MKELEGVNNVANDLLEEVYRSFDKKNKFKLKDKVLLGLFNSIIEKIESIKILCNNDQYSGTDILLRSVFEASVILRFIVNQHTKDRATAYYLSIQLKEIEVAEKLLKDDDIGKIIRRYIKAVNTISEFDFMKETDKIDLIKKDFKKLTSASKSDKWLNLQNHTKERNGKKVKLNSFRDLCEYMGDEEIAEYELIYRMLSQEVHAKEIKEYFKEEDGYMYITKKNSSKMIISLSKSLVISSAKIIAKKYSMSKYYYNRMRVMGYQRYINNSTFAP